MEMIEQEHGLHTADFLGVGGRNISYAGVVKNKTVVANYLYVGILLKQPGLVNLLIVNGR